LLVAGNRAAGSVRSGAGTVAGLAAGGIPAEALTNTIELDDRFPRRWLAARTRSHCHWRR
jgi:hypothetical protein